MSKTKVLFLATLVVLVAVPIFAQQPAAGGGAPVAGGGVKWGVIGAAFAIGMAAFGGAFSQGRTAAAACEGMARNPGAAGVIRIMALLGLAFIESLVIYALVIAFIIQGK